MKKIILLFILLSNCIYAQKSKSKFWLDPKGNEVKVKLMSKLSEIYPNNSMAFRKTKDSGMVYQINAPKYSTFQGNYNTFKKEIERVSNKQFSDSTIFIISYNYLDDPCSDQFSNKMSKKLINQRKEFYDEKIQKINEKNPQIIFICLFEKEIELMNNINDKNEYFFSDKENMFRNNIFLNPTLCGSFGIIKPNGETLVKNGEDMVENIVELIKPRKWAKFFKK